jgi:hypothetical protein
MNISFVPRLFFALALAFSLQPSALLCAQQIITAQVAITNFTVNGETITVNGTLRTWTNNVTSAQNQIATNNTIMGAWTNLFYAYAAVPQSGVNLLPLSTNTVQFQSYAGLGLTVSVSTNWATITWSTNSLVQATVVRVPLTAVGPDEQTNTANGLVQYLNYAGGTIQLNTNAPSFQQFWWWITNAIVYAQQTNQPSIQTISNYFVLWSTNFITQSALTNAAIASAAGTGSNITLNGATILNNTNLSIYPVATNTGLIPLLYGNTNQPLGTVSTASSYGISSAFEAFANQPANLWYPSTTNYTFALTANPTWICYQFPSPTAVSSFSSLVLNSYTTATLSIQGSLDNTNWTTLWTTSMVSSATWYTNQFTPLATSGTFSFYRFYTPTANSSLKLQAQLYGPAENVLYSTNLLTILSTNGVNVVGALNASSIAINGVSLPIYMATNSYQTIYASGGTGNAAIYNSAFTLLGGYPIYTNAQGCVLYLPGVYAYGGNNYVNQFYQLSTNISFSAFNVPQTFNSQNLFGTYQPYAGSSGTVTISTSQQGASGSVGIQTNSSGPHGVSLIFTNGTYIGTTNY